MKDENKRKTFTVKSQMASEGILYDCLNHAPAKIAKDNFNRKPYYLENIYNEKRKTIQ